MYIKFIGLDKNFTEQLNTTHMIYDTYIHKPSRCLYTSCTVLLSYIALVPPDTLYPIHSHCTLGTTKAPPIQEQVFSNTSMTTYQSHTTHHIISTCILKCCFFFIRTIFQRPQGQLFKFSRYFLPLIVQDPHHAITRTENTFENHNNFQCNLLKVVRIM